MTTLLTIIIGLLSSSYLMTVESAKCDKLDDKADDLLENCKVEDLDKKVCHNLDLTLEQDDEDKSFGRDYQYLGAVKLTDGSGNMFPIYKQKSPPTGFKALTMYHSGQMLIATEDLEELKNGVYAFKSKVCSNDFHGNNDYYDFELCSGEANVRDKDRNGFENMELTIQCTDPAPTLPPPSSETTTQLTPIIAGSPSATTLTNTTGLNITTVAGGEISTTFAAQSSRLTTDSKLIDRTKTSKKGNKPDPDAGTPGFALKNQVEGYTMLLPLAPLFFQF